MKMKWMISGCLVVAAAIVCGQSSITEPLLNNAEPLTVTEFPPTFEGGRDKYYHFLFTHLRYPAKAREKNIQGTVVVQFVVDVDSIAKRIEVIQRLGGGCDEEALRLVDLMNAEKKWIPGGHQSIPHPVVYTIPVKFKLDIDEKPGRKKKN
jgi:TonB family protein